LNNDYWSIARLLSELYSRFHPVFGMRWSCSFIDSTFPNCLSHWHFATRKTSTFGTSSSISLLRQTNREMPALILDSVHHCCGQGIGLQRHGRYTRLLLQTNLDCRTQARFLGSPRNLEDGRRPGPRFGCVSSLHQFGEIVKGIRTCFEPFHQRHLLPNQPTLGDHSRKAVFRGTLRSTKPGRDLLFEFSAPASFANSGVSVPFAEGARRAGDFAERASNLNDTLVTVKTKAV
jgi:hypothetical protein